MRHGTGRAHGREGLQAAQGEPAFKGGWYGAPGMLNGFHLVEKLIALAEHQRSHQDVTVAGEVLSGGMHRDVATEFERPLQERRSPGIVRGDLSARPVRNRDQCWYVADVQEGVGGRLIQMSFVAE